MPNNIYAQQIPQFLKKSKKYDVVATDLKGDYVYINQTFKDRFSFITQDFIGKPSAISIHPDDLNRAQEVVHICLSNPDEVVPIQLRKPIKLESGFYWTQWEFSVITNKDLEPIGILCIGHDITEPKQNIIKLKESKIKLKKTIEAIPHPMLILDENNCISYINREVEVVFGYSNQDIKNEPIKTLFPEDFINQYNSFLSVYRKRGAPTTRVNKYFYCLSKQKEKIVVGASLSSFQTNNKQNVIIILEDLTNLKHYQDTIINQNKALRQISWKQSHEIRKPVVNILGLSNMFNNEQLDHNSNLKAISFIKEAAIELDKMTRSIVLEANLKEYNIELKKHKRHLF
jgi:PAS domain S-box-containing protein